MVFSNKLEYKQDVFIFVIIGFFTYIYALHIYLGSLPYIFTI